MSQQSMQAIIGKAIIDTAFRQHMFADPEVALADFDLTDGEVAALRAIDFETMECCARTLDDRISRAFILSLHARLTRNDAAASQQTDGEKDGSHENLSRLISYNRATVEGWP
ncbi:MAG: Franean1_4349 family RiPP [Anaerolineae bacterium]|nr:Franean1_4349 family RiPP [Anaerolineae bacterium]